MTFNGDYELRFELRDHDGVFGELSYYNFKIFSEKNQYKLNIGNVKRDLEKEALFPTVLHDSFSSMNKGSFSTKDRDNDRKETNSMAQKYKTAGWLKKERQLKVNLFGANLNKVETGNKDWKGVSWQSFRGSRYSLSKLIMAVRPSQHHVSGKISSMEKYS